MKTLRLFILAILISVTGFVSGTTIYSIGISSKSTQVNTSGVIHTDSVLCGSFKSNNNLSIPFSGSENIGVVLTNNLPLTNSIIDSTSWKFTYEQLQISITVNSNSPDTFTITQPMLVSKILDSIGYPAQPGDIIVIEVISFHAFSGTNTLTLTVPGSTTTGINSVISSMPSLKIYPNPVTDKFTITTDAPNNEVYNLYTPSGQLVTAGKLENANTELQLSALLPGMYFLRVNGQTFKVIKE